MKPNTDLQIAKQQLITVAINCKPLGLHGMGVPGSNKESLEERMARQVENKALLADPDDSAVVAMAWCMDWMTFQNKVKYTNKSHTSYGYKHRVEQYVRDQGSNQYIPEGIFIAAAIASGFDALVEVGHNSATFQFGKKGLKAAHNRL